MSIEIALLLSMVTAGISLVAAVTNYRKNSRRDGERDGRQAATLDHIKERVDEVWAGYKRTEERFSELERRISLLEMGMEAL